MLVFPSVANTGVPGRYVNEIFQRFWRDFEGKDASQIPVELLTMAVSFDADGNPVCSVDLAKYGLSMPVIEPKPDKYYRGEYTVTFPHDKNREPGLGDAGSRDAEPDGATPEAAPPPSAVVPEAVRRAGGGGDVADRDAAGNLETKNCKLKTHSLPYIAIPALLALLGVAAWRLSRRKR